jgi:signal transduction histidine kinase
LIPPDRPDEEPGILARICRGEPVEHYETVRRRKDGSEVMVSLTVSPIRDQESRIIGASKIARNITEQKRTEQALKEAKEIAEAANRSKDHFLAVLSHELRTPLTPVLMTASVLEMDPTVPPGLRADMAMIRRNVELETKLIDDLLDLSRITSGKLPLRPKIVSVNEAVRAVGAICESEMAAKGVRFELELAADVGNVRADPARLQQILWNILKNAAKFTPRGGVIHLRTSRTARDVRITVRDSGIGIEAPKLAKIFDAFEQGDTQITRQFGGLGLGLAITKALVELHDGKIRAESAGTGQGSTFEIELPVDEGEDPLEDSTAPVSRRHGSLRLLLVEDHPDTSAMLARLLRNAGYAVTVANTAGEALECSEREVFDLVVSDLGLPDISGYEFLQRLLARRAIPAIAMSGYGMEEDVRRSLEAGFREHLVKPVTMPSLEQAIRRLACR